MTCVSLSSSFPLWRPEAKPRRVRLAVPSTQTAVRPEVTISSLEMAGEGPGQKSPLSTTCQVARGLGLIMEGLVGSYNKQWLNQISHLHAWVGNPDTQRGQSHAQGHTAVSPGDRGLPLPSAHLAPSTDMISSKHCFVVTSRVTAQRPWAVSHPSRALGKPVPRKSWRYPSAPLRPAPQSSRLTRTGWWQRGQGTWEWPRAVSKCHPWSLMGAGYPWEGEMEALPAGLTHVPVRGRRLER